MIIQLKSSKDSCGNIYFFRFDTANQTFSNFAGFHDVEIKSTRSNMHTLCAGLIEEGYREK